MGQTYQDGILMCSREGDLRCGIYNMSSDTWFVKWLAPKRCKQLINYYLIIAGLLQKTCQTFTQDSPVRTKDNNVDCLDSTAAVKISATIAMAGEEVWIIGGNGRRKMILHLENGTKIFVHLLFKGRTRWTASPA